MAKTGNIDTSNKISTESYSSRGQRFTPMSQPAKKNTAPNLRKGEIIYGQVLEKLSDNIFKLNLSNGVFNAIIHPKLKQGDKLYFLVNEINPSLTISVHSIDVVMNSGELDIDETIRILDIPDNLIERSIIIEYSKRVKRLLRYAIINMSERVKEYKNRKKQYSLTHSIEFILVDLYISGYNVQDENVLNFVFNYISPNSIKIEDNTILPAIGEVEKLNDFRSPFVKSLYVRNLIARLNDSQAVYYTNINGKNYRLELFRKHKILQAIVSDGKSINFKIVINLRDNNVKIFYNHPNAILNKVQKIDVFNISYEISNHIFINSFSENIDNQNQSTTYVL